MHINGTRSQQPKKKIHLNYFRTDESQVGPKVLLVKRFERFGASHSVSRLTQPNLEIFGVRCHFLRFLGLEPILSVFSHFGPYFSRKNIKVVGQNWFGIFSAFYVSFKVLGLDWADFCPIWRFFWSMSHLDKFLTLLTPCHIWGHI